VRVQVPAMDVAALHPVEATDAVTYDADGRRLANGHVAVTFDEQGLFAGVLDVAAGREVLAAGERGNLLQLHPDLPSEYDAWDLDDYYRRQVSDLVELDRFEVLDTGPLVGRVRISRAFRSSTVVQVVELRAGSPRIDVHTEIDWHERDHVLTAAFPTAVPLGGRVHTGKMANTFVGERSSPARLATPLRAFQVAFESGEMKCAP